MSPVWGYYTVAIIVVLAVILLQPTDARAITFGDWATNQGWPAGYVVPDTVDAQNASIDNLAGMGNYNWITTPTDSLYLSDNQITSNRIGRVRRAGQVGLPVTLTETKSRASNRATSPGWTG